ncbi:hypothetical protein JKF63_04982 [Porcisia hertigi]|uniref:Guanine nucleotide-binding protein subunit beta-like protein n=1 Tax=Porcisia hertigi TaxID=2761500 RepID=A0A836HTR6_9TRYP|nr:hypothetical protein JKF63_04982 [Porcisia hertigi]
MGNTCMKTGEAVDHHNGAVYNEYVSGGKKTKQHAMPGKAVGTPEKKKEVFAGETTAVVNKIEALQHTLKPIVSVVNPALRHQEFRQFTSVFAPGRAVLALASCARFQGPQHILAAGEDRCVALLNYETGHVMRRWVHAHENDINCITTPSSSGRFATASRDKTVKVWDFNSDGPLACLRGHTLNVTCVDTTADYNLLVSGSKDNTVRLWNVERAEEIFCGDIKLNIVRFVRFMPLMNCVAQGSEDLAVRLWDVRTKGSHSDLHLSKTIEGMGYYPVCCETVPDDPHMLLTGHCGVNGCGSYVTQWDVRTGKCMALYRGHSFTVSSVRMVAASVYGKGSFFTSSYDGTFGIWNLEDGEANREVDLSAEHQFHLPEGRVTTFEAEDNGDTVIALDSGCLVVLRPAIRDDSVIPSLRLRYVGVLKVPT